MQEDTVHDRGQTPVPARQQRRFSARRAGVARRIQRRRLLWLLPKGGTCVEIGSWRGDNAARLLASRRPQKMYLVDPWEYREEEKYNDAWFGAAGRSGQQDMDAIYESVIARFRPNIDSGQLVVKRMRSIDAASSFADDSLDWVYVDGDHSYEGVKDDLEAYYRAVKPGGFLAGDDYEGPGWWGDGVKRAVDEFAVRCGGVKVLGSQFLLKKP